MKNKFLVGGLTALSFLTVAPTLLQQEVSAAYNDMIEGSYYNGDLKNSLEKKFISEERLGNPKANITRAEFASLVYNASGQTANYTHTFKDVNSNHPYTREIAGAAALGLVVGYEDGTFKPNDFITREEMAIMILRYMNHGKYEFNHNVSIKDFNDKNIFRYPHVISTLRGDGVIGGHNDNTYKPQDKITKQEAIALLMRAENNVTKQKNALTKTGLVTGDINVRYTANFSASSFGVLKKGQTVSYKVINDNWYMVEFDNTVGYVYAIYVLESPNNENSNQIGDYYELVAPNAVSKYKTLNEAKNEMSSDTYIKKNGEIIAMNSGVAYAKQLVNIYDKKGNAFTYVATGTELHVDYLDGEKAYITIGNFSGYVNKNEVILYPQLEANNRSYYAINSSGVLVNQIYNESTKKYQSFVMGRASSNLKQNTKYYSNKNFNINGQEIYPYYNYLPLRTKSNYTGAEIDRYIAYKSPNSPLIGKGQTFVDAANAYDMNPLYLVANAIHESGYGLSEIAIDKKNLFGFKAYDASAYDSAANFATLEEGIYYCAEFISSNYLNPSSWRYYNAVLGDKSLGMNVKYASDMNWGAKIAGHMYSIDSFLGNKDYKKYQYGTLAQGTSLYDGNGNRTKSLEKDRMVAIEQTVSIGGNVYYKVFADELSVKYHYIQKQDITIHNTF